MCTFILNFFFLFKLFHRSKQNIILDLRRNLVVSAQGMTLLGQTRFLRIKIEVSSVSSQALRQVASHRKVWSMFDTDPLLRVEVIHIILFSILRVTIQYKTAVKVTAGYFLVSDVTRTSSHIFVSVISAETMTLQHRELQPQRQLRR
jgi:hypothetical protein